MNGDVLVEVSGEIPPDEIADLVDWCNGLGFKTYVDSDATDRDSSNLQWLWLIAPLTPFFTGLLEEAGRSTFEVVSRRLRSIFRGKIAPEGSGPHRRVVLSDETRGIQVVMPDDLSPQALEELAKLDWARLAPGVLEYRDDTGQWELKGRAPVRTDNDQDR